MAKEERGCDTVGAAAVDCHGNTAYATSTGGISGKLPGRVGDSPIIGMFIQNTIAQHVLVLDLHSNKPIVIAASV